MSKGSLCHSSRYGIQECETQNSVNRSSQFRYSEPESVPVAVPGGLSASYISQFPEPSSPPGPWTWFLWGGFDGPDPIYGDWA